MHISVALAVAQIVFGSASVPITHGRRSKQFRPGKAASFPQRPELGNHGERFSQVTEGQPGSQGDVNLVGLPQGV